jgi:hypothetical protein
LRENFQSLTRWSAEEEATIFEVWDREVEEKLRTQSMWPWRTPILRSSPEGSMEWTVMWWSRGVAAAVRRRRREEKGRTWRDSMISEEMGWGLESMKTRDAPISVLGREGVAGGRE